MNFYSRIYSKLCCSVNNLWISAFVCLQDSTELVREEMVLKGRVCSLVVALWNLGDFTAEELLVLSCTWHTPRYQDSIDFLTVSEVSITSTEHVHKPHTHIHSSMYHCNQWSSCRFDWLSPEVWDFSRWTVRIIGGQRSKRWDDSLYAFLTAKAGNCPFSLQRQDTALLW
jgi:hypothetical protein